MSGNLRSGFRPVPGQVPIQGTGRGTSEDSSARQTDMVGVLRTIGEKRSRCDAGPLTGRRVCAAIGDR